MGLNPERDDDDPHDQGDRKAGERQPHGHPGRFDEVGLVLVQEFRPVHRGVIVVVMIFDSHA